MITALEFKYGTFRNPDLFRIAMDFHDGQLETRALLEGRERKRSFDREKSAQILEDLEHLYLRTWQRVYTPEGMEILDGFHWNLSYTDSEDLYPSGICGSNAYPWCFYKLIRIILETEPEAEGMLRSCAKEVACFY